MKERNTLVVRKLSTQSDLRDGIDYVQYYLRTDRQAEEKTKQNSKAIHLNSLVGKKISLKSTGNIFCIVCNRSIKKTFNGFCYPCFTKLARADLCQVRPETCHFHRGTCREEAWGEKHCFIPHSLYLSYTSDWKVGITRSYQKENRWMDQGAILALEMGQLSNRYLVGQVEHSLKGFIADKTHWQRMLKTPNLEEFGEGSNDLQREILEKKESITNYVNDFFKNEETIEKEYLPAPKLIRQFIYPITMEKEEQGNLKIKSFSLEKEPDKVLEGKLVAIKGQYFFCMSEDRIVRVFNVRKFEGYEIEFAVMEG